MGKSTISMAIFNCYVSSPEGMSTVSHLYNLLIRSYKLIPVANKGGHHLAQIVFRWVKRPFDTPGGTEYDCSTFQKDKWMSLSIMGY